VTLAARDVERAHAVFGELPVRVVQAPICTKTYSGLQEPPLNYAEILMRYGYLDGPLLAGMLRAWRGLFDIVRPEVLIADHAPTALLAARGMRVGRIVTGAPFTVPAPADTTPNLRPWVEVPRERLASSDAAVLAIANRGLPPGADRLSAVMDIFDGAAPLICGVPEIDPYAPRRNAQYLGLHGGLMGSAAPQWPDGNGPRLFAYLQADYRHIDAALAALAASGARCVVFMAAVPPALREKHEGAHLRFSAGMLDLDRTVTESDLCVTHGNFGTISEVLRRGRPMVALPLDLEKFLTAIALHKLNVGCFVHPDVPQPDFAGAIRLALSDRSMADAARSFAERHRVPAVDTIVQRAADLIEEAARNGGGARG